MGLSVGFIFLNFLLSPKKPDPEKLSAYECGFEAFGDSRMEFGNSFFISMGHFIRKNWINWILVNDVFSFYTYNWIYL